jgi:hypothetical protein
MLLNTVESVRDDLGYDSMPDIDNAITEALNTAEIGLATALGCNFGQVTVTDTFFIERPYWRRYPAVRTVLRLTKPFVPSLTSAGMVTDKLDNFTNPAQVKDISANLVLDSDKGFATDFTTNYYYSFVRIVYTAGFPVSESDPTSYDLTVVPAWLQLAAQLNAKILLDGHPALEDTAVKLDTKVLMRQLAVALNGRLRYSPNALFALNAS